MRDDGNGVRLVQFRFPAIRIHVYLVRHGAGPEQFGMAGRVEVREDGRGDAVERRVVRGLLRVEVEHHAAHHVAENVMGAEGVTSVGADGIAPHACEDREVEIPFLAVAGGARLRDGAQDVNRPPEFDQHVGDRFVAAAVGGRFLGLQLTEGGIVRQDVRLCGGVPGGRRQFGGRVADGRQGRQNRDVGLLHGQAGETRGDGIAHDVHAVVVCDRDVHLSSFLVFANRLRTARVLLREQFGIGCHHPVADAHIGCLRRTDVPHIGADDTAEHLGRHTCPAGGGGHIDDADFAVLHRHDDDGRLWPDTDGGRLGFGSPIRF